VSFVTMSICLLFVIVIPFFGIECAENRRKYPTHLRRILLPITAGIILLFKINVLNIFKICFVNAI
jgi:hypothetical protein